MGRKNALDSQAQKPEKNRSKMNRCAVKCRHRAMAAGDIRPQKKKIREGKDIKVYTFVYTCEET